MKYNVKAILYKSLSKLNKIYFYHTVKNILKTPPINYQHDKSVVIITMLSHDAINMYLVAIKSFLKNFGYGSIEVIDDGTLTKYDIAVLEYHVPEITFSNANHVDTLSCPTYISWKRLFRIAEITKKSYVIQLDSDTVSLAALINIQDKVQANEGFLIGSSRWEQGVDVGFLNKIVNYWNHSHVQPSAEMIFKDIEFFKDGTKYLRACAGFSGYPKNFASTDEIEKLSAQIEDKIGKKWHEWGSEQTATMCLISKTPNASVLPWPKYQNFMEPLAKDSINSASFIHFIGSNRFKNSTYSVQTKKIIRGLISMYR